eukprot:GEMP01005817.1.p1 GENE.GEMP01005817.1~~GEMP01005817.1.p1  ORF type:complete len:746 (+),score=172.77 GEMP01005817.1:568-2805(+)
MALRLLVLLWWTPTAHGKITIQDDITFSDEANLHLEENAYDEGTKFLNDKWDVGTLEDTPTTAGDFASITACYNTTKFSDTPPDFPVALFLHGGKAYPLRSPKDGNGVLSTVSDAIFELYNVRNPSSTFILQDIPVVNHLDVEYQDSDTPWVAVSRATVDDMTKSLGGDNDVFARVFNQVEQRSYGRVFFMNLAPIPFFKWHVSKTRIKPFSNTTERSRFFQQDLKLSAWNAFRRKMHSAKQIVRDTFKAARKPPKFFLKQLMNDVLYVTAEKMRADLEQLVDSFVPGSDALEIAESASKSAGLLVSTGMVGIPVKGGVQVQKHKAQKMKIARNGDGTFNVNYSFLRRWDGHVSTAVGFATNQMVDVSGVVVVRPYKKSCEWSFVQGDLKVTDAAEYLESFVNGTLKEHYAKYFSSGQRTLVRGGDVSFGFGSVATLFSSSMTHLPGIFANVGIHRSDKTELKQSTDTGKLEPADLSTANWCVEPPTVGFLQPDGSMERIQNNQEDFSLRRFGRNLLTKSFWKTLWKTGRLGELVDPESRVIDYATEGGFLKRFLPMLHINPVKKMLGEPVYRQLLSEAETAITDSGKDFDKKTLFFQVKYTLSQDADKELRNEFADDEKRDEKRLEILDDPGNHPDSLDVNVALTTSKEYTLGLRAGFNFVVTTEKNVFAKVTLSSTFTLLKHKDAKSRVEPPEGPHLRRSLRLSKRPRSVSDSGSDGKKRKMEQETSELATKKPKLQTVIGGI